MMRMGQHHKMKSENSLREWLGDIYYGALVGLIILGAGTGALSVVILIGVAFGWW